MTDQSHPQNSLESISRRELLKALAASSTALAAAAFLPAKWISPVVDGGVLPGHAQASNICTNFKIVSSGEYYPYNNGIRMSFDYYDPDNLLTKNAVIHYWTTDQTCPLNGSIAMNDDDVQWDQLTGYITFTVPSNCMPANLYVYVNLGPCRSADSELMFYEVYPPV